MKVVVKVLKNGKSVGVDTIPAELVQAGGEAMVDVLTSICKKRMADHMDSATGCYTSKERKRATVSKLQNHQTKIEERLK